MQVIEVNDKRDLSRFINLPRAIYQGDPNWICPLDYIAREKFNRNKNSFFQHGWAKLFLAIDGDVVLGRVVASDDLRYNEENCANTGMFGFFECIDDQNVANVLFDAATKALKTERGRDLAFGPVEFSNNHEFGLLVEGFDSPAQIMMPYNPPYYAKLLENYGFEKVKDLYSWWFDEEMTRFETKWRPVVEKLQAKNGFIVRPFSLKNFDVDVAKCIEIYDQGRGQWMKDSVSLTEAEIHEFSKMLRAIAHPNQVLLAEQGGKTIGFSITVPDFNEAIRPLNGKLSWFGVPYLGILRLKYRLSRVRGARMMVLCVLPEFRKRGVAERLILDMLSYGRDVLKYHHAELGWTDESNEKIMRVLERIGAKRCKRYQTFRKKI